MGEFHHRPERPGALLTGAAGVGTGFKEEGAKLD
jgi:hypothetical protein